MAPRRGRNAEEKCLSQTQQEPRYVGHPVRDTVTMVIHNTELPVHILKSCRKIFFTLRIPRQYLGVQMPVDKRQCLAQQSVPKLQIKSVVKHLKLSSLSTLYVLNHSLTRQCRC